MSSPQLHLFLKHFHPHLNELEKNENCPFLTLDTLRGCALESPGKSYGSKGWGENSLGSGGVCGLYTGGEGGTAMVNRSMLYLLRARKASSGIFLYISSQILCTTLRWRNTNNIQDTLSWT